MDVKWISILLSSSRKAERFIRWTAHTYDPFGGSGEIVGDHIKTCYGSY